MAEIIRKIKFGKLPLQVLGVADLSPRAKVIYVALGAICGYKAGEVYHSGEELGRLIGCEAKTTVYNAVRELLDIGLIERKSKHQLSYRPLPWEAVNIEEGVHQPSDGWWERSGKSA